MQNTQNPPGRVIKPAPTVDSASEGGTNQAGKKPKPGEKSAATSAAVPPRHDSWRETVESIVVAFVLAFLFRTFEAEAFVIPTGSMAPTLYGQHRDVHCKKFGTRFAVGASGAVDGAAVVRGGTEDILVHGAL